jgi:aspartate aminotransferase
MDLLTTQAQELRLSATLEINELVQSRLAQGKDVVHLGFGEAIFPIHESVLEAHSKASKNTSYMPVAGFMRLREVHFHLHALRQYILSSSMIGRRM